VRYSDHDRYSIRLLCESYMRNDTIATGEMFIGFAEIATPLTAIVAVKGVVALMAFPNEKH
jgi:hypothetical protein